MIFSFLYFYIQPTNWCHFPPEWAPHSNLFPALTPSHRKQSCNGASQTLKCVWESSNTLVTMQILTGEARTGACHSAFPMCSQVMLTLLLGEGPHLTPLRTEILLFSFYLQHFHSLSHGIFTRPYSILWLFYVYIFYYAFLKINFDRRNRAMISFFGTTATNSLGILWVFNACWL